MRSFPIKALLFIGLLLLGAACQLVDNGMGMFAIACLVGAFAMAANTYRAEINRLTDDSGFRAWLGGHR